MTHSKKLLLNIFRHYRKVQTSLHELTYLFWECTLRCNLNCIHCGSDCHKESIIKDMPYLDFVKVLEKVRKHYNPNKTLIVLTGGEPLLRDDLEEACLMFNKMGFPWGMVSNGYDFTEEKFESLLRRGLTSLTISLDGLENSHNWMRGKKDSFKKAIKSISIAAKEKNMVFDVVTCANKRNFSELSEIKELLISNNVRKWRIFTIFPKGRAKDNDDLKLDNSQFIDLMNFITNNNKEGRIETSFGCEGFLGNFENKARRGFFFCRAGINVSSVLANGDISACPSLRGDYIQGNIYKDDFIDVWQNKYDIMRNRSWTKTGECEKCKVYKWCEGNGLHLRDEKTGELLMCHYNIIENSSK